MKPLELSKPYEEELAVFLSMHPYRDLCIDGAEYHYLLCGKGETTLVFLVGGMGLSYLYMPYILALESDYQILTFDYPYAFDDNASLADGISALLRHLNIESGILIGSSYGGYVAQIFARKHPEQTGGLCLFSTASLSERTISTLKEKYQKLAPVLLWVLKYVPYAWLKPAMTAPVCAMPKTNLRRCMRICWTCSASSTAITRASWIYT